MDLLKRRIAKADARLATALAVESRVHRECGQQLHEQKVTSMVCRQDTLLAMRRHEDAVYALHLRIRNAAATRIQGLYRGGRAWQSYMLKLDTLEAALDDFHQIAVREEDRLITGAATRLQGFCRILQARERVFNKVKEEYEKRFDKITGSYYYFISRTQRSVWHKPKILRSRDLPVVEDPKKKKKRKKNKKQRPKGNVATDERESNLRKGGNDQKCSAAVIIQGLARRKIARRRVIERTKQTFEKLYDDDSGAFYYWNLVTGEAQWHKPRILGSRDDCPMAEPDVN